MPEPFIFLLIITKLSHKVNLDCAKCHEERKGGGNLVFALEKKDGFGNDLYKKFR